MDIIAEISGTYDEDGAELAALLNHFLQLENTRNDFDLQLTSSAKVYRAIAIEAACASDWNSKKGRPRNGSTHEWLEKHYPKPDLGAAVTNTLLEHAFVLTTRFNHKIPTCKIEDLGIEIGDIPCANGESTLSRLVPCQVGYIFFAELKKAATL